VRDTLDLRYRYSVEGSAEVPVVTVQHEHGQWSATVMLARTVATIHMTCGYDRIEEAVTAAERFIVERYQSAVVVRVSDG
jgi:hypothetical protein